MLALAALSARVLAEAAAADGLAALALDLFGDADTQRHAVAWRGIGAAHDMRIDGEKLLAALGDAGRRGGLRGWIAGSGFDGRPELLERGAALLPLLGTAADDVRRVRDAQQFFALLSSHGIGFPPTAFERPVSTAGWLVKDGGGCGGWQVRRASPADRPGSGLYWQRERPGRPMSATFIGNGRDAALLGINEQGTSVLGERPFVFTRVLGPVPVGERVQRELAAVARLLAGVFRVRGLASLDFLLDGDTVEVLELNPRPPASLALYPSVGRGGPLRAHLRACEHGELPAAPCEGSIVRGSEIVFAPHALHIGAPQAAAIAACEGTHDLPRAGTRFAAGEPLCSVVAEGGDAHEVSTRLTGRRRALMAALERSNE